MKIIDISKEMLSAEVFPGDTVPQLERVTAFEKYGFTTSDLRCCLHNGTHADAPRHIGENDGIDGISLEKCFGRCAVITVNGRLNSAIMRVLGGLSFKRALFKGAEIDMETAEKLSAMRFDLLGVDGLSVGDFNVHKSLLCSGAVILEGLNLKNVEDGEYIIAAFPLKIKGADGAPVRAVLIEE